jgi:RND family efflux transporter MFP subunit
MRLSLTPAVCAMVSLAVGAMVALAACGKPAAPPAQGPAAVSVAVPLKERVVDWDDFTGRFEAPEQVEVRARAGGYLQAVHFREGQIVRKGQLLFTLDPRAADAAQAAARAQAELARGELARAEQLLSAQAISKEEFEGRRSGAAVAEAALRARALDVEFTRVTAPISGMISQRRVDPGNLIAGGTSAGDVLATIVAVDPIHFSFDASEAQLLKYQRQAGSRAGAPVQVKLQDEAEPRWTGVVDYLDNRLDPQSGTARLRAVIRNPNGFLKPGMFGSARMMGSGAYEALLIPETALVSDGPRKIAYVVNAQNAVEARTLQLGPLNNGLRVIRGGLSPTDKVVVNGMQRVRPGAPVQPKTVTITRQAPGAPAAKGGSTAEPKTATPAG